jgi:hypothetical protein
LHPPKTDLLVRSFLTLRLIAGIQSDFNSNGPERAGRKTGGLPLPAGVEKRKSIDGKSNTSINSRNLCFLSLYFQFSDCWVYGVVEIYYSAVQLAFPSNLDPILKISIHFKYIENECPAIPVVGIRIAV